MLAIVWKDEWAPVARRHAALGAVTDAEGTLSYGALFDRAAGVAAALIAGGVVPGDSVGILLPNGRDVVAASLGAALAGAAEVGMNPALAGDEIRHCLTVAQCRVVLTDAGQIGWLRDAGVAVIDVATLAPAAFEALPRVPVPPGAAARVTFTSGTTGKPKGIVHDTAARWTQALLMRATLPETAQPGRTILLMTPYCHGAGLLTHAYLQGGARVILRAGVRQDICDAALQQGADQIFAPPTVLAKLCGFYEGRRVDGIRTIFCGTAPLSAELYARAKTIFGPVIRITYGKSEVFNPITILAPDEVDALFAAPDPEGAVCVGWPAPGVEIRIADPDPGDPMPERGDGARVGQVLLRAQHMLAATRTAEGSTPHLPQDYHRTGDLGFIDAEGRLSLVGRESDVFKTGGYRVTAGEIEALLRPHLAGGEIVAVALPSAYWGEIVALAGAGMPPGWKEALEPALAAMTPYKRPRLMVDLPELPRNGQGKVVRRRVVEAILAAWALIDGPYPELVASDAASSDC